MDKQQALQRLFYDLKQGGYVGSEKLARQARRRYGYLGITEKDAKAFVDRQYVAQVHLPNALTRRPIDFPQTADHLDDHWQADILVLQKYQQYNRGYQYVLCVIDVFSRQALGVATKNRDVVTVKPILEHLFAKRKPKILTTDNEGCLVANEMKPVYREHGIKHVACYPEDHARMGMIERFNRTLRAILEKAMTDHDTFNWIQFLEDSIEGYNSSPHSALGNYSPKEVTKVAHLIPKSNKVREQLATQRMIDGGYLVSPGDIVRIKLQKNSFDKSAEPSFSKDLYKVEKERSHKFTVRDDVTGEKMKRPFRYYELLKVSPEVEFNPFKKESTKETSSSVANAPSRAQKRAFKELASFLPPGPKEQPEATKRQPKPKSLD